MFRDSHFDNEVSKINTNRGHGGTEQGNNQHMNQMPAIGRRSVSRLDVGGLQVPISTLIAEFQILTV
jgi:hypothetical protein